MKHTIQSFVLLLLFNCSRVIALCYFPDGETVANQDTPCEAEDESFCCGQGFACMSNKLCKLTSYVRGAGPGQSTFVRGSCSDRNWGQACPNFCVTTSYGDTQSGAMGLAQCADNDYDSYFCLDRRVDEATSTFSDAASATAFVCSQADYQVVFQGEPSTLTIIGVPATTSTSSTSSSTSSSTTKPSSSLPGDTAGATGDSTTPGASSTPLPTQSSSGTNLSLAIGAGVGVPLGVIALSLIAFFAWRYRRAKKRDEANMTASESAPTYAYKEAPSSLPHEQPHNDRPQQSGAPHEFPGNNDPSELPGSYHRY